MQYITIYTVKRRLHVKYNYFEIILKLFWCSVSHVATSETEIKIISAAGIISQLFQRC